MTEEAAQPVDAARRREDREARIDDLYGRDPELDGYFGIGRAGDPEERGDQVRYDRSFSSDTTITDHGGQKTTTTGLYSRTEDDVADRGHAQAPSDIRKLEEDRRTGSAWDNSSLSKAAHWLRWESDFANNNRVAMEDIADLMALSREGQPREGHTSPLGSFTTANQLAGQNASVYQAVHDGLRKIRRALINAAEATERIASNYREVEERNRLSAEQIKRSFAEAENNDN